MRRLPIAFLAVLAFFACTGCTSLPIEWTGGRDAIAVTARGPAGALLIIVAGPPSGPYTLPGQKDVWATVGPTVPHRKGGIEVTRATFDADGVARATFSAGLLPPGPVLVQAVAIAPGERPRALAVSDCMAVVRAGDGLTLRPHVLEVLGSPVWWSIAATALIGVAFVALRRVRAAAAPVRAAATVILLGFGAWMLVARVLERELPRIGSRDRPTPLLHLGDIAGGGVPDPLDRVTLPGFHELMTAVRQRAREVISVVPQDQDASQRDAWQAAWILWPLKVALLEPREDPYAHRGLYLSLGEASPRTGARILFKNRAGCLWSIDAGEPK